MSKNITLPLLLFRSGECPEVPTPESAIPGDENFNEECHLMIGQSAYNVVDDLWYYRSRYKITPLLKEDDEIQNLLSQMKSLTTQVSSFSQSIANVLTLIENTSTEDDQLSPIIQVDDTNAKVWLYNDIVFSFVVANLSIELHSLTTGESLGSINLPLTTGDYVQREVIYHNEKFYLIAADGIFSTAKSVILELDIVNLVASVIYSKTGGLISVDYDNENIYYYSYEVGYTSGDLVFTKFDFANNSSTTLVFTVPDGYNKTDLRSFVIEDNIYIPFFQNEDVTYFRYHTENQELDLNYQFSVPFKDESSVNRRGVPICHQKRIDDKFLIVGDTSRLLYAVNFETQDYLVFDMKTICSKTLGSYINYHIGNLCILEDNSVIIQYYDAVLQLKDNNVEFLFNDSSAPMSYNIVSKDNYSLIGSGNYNSQTCCFNISYEGLRISEDNPDYTLISKYISGLFGRNYYFKGRLLKLN